MLDHAGCTTPTRQRDLHHTDQESVSLAWHIYIMNWESVIYLPNNTCSWAQISLQRQPLYVQLCEHSKGDRTLGGMTKTIRSGM